MEFTAVGKTDVGRKREGNEDNHCVAPDLGLFVVCDGMGGHAAGEVASRLGVETIQTWMAKYLGGEATAQVGEPLPNYSRKSNFLVSSIQMANRAIYEAAQGKQEYAGMGTTVVAVLSLGDQVALAHVGDSRIYRIRNGQISQLSRDHSLVQLQLDRGIISPEEAHESQYRHMITRALGLKDSVEVDLEEQPVQAGDVLLLCSDGLSDLVEDREMLATVQEHANDLEKACQALLDRANFKGGDDNITALLIQARGDDRDSRGKREQARSLVRTEVRVSRPSRGRRGFWRWLKDLFS